MLTGAPSSHRETGFPFPLTSLNPRPADPYLVPSREAPAKNTGGGRDRMLLAVEGTSRPTSACGFQERLSPSPLPTPRCVLPQQLPAHLTGDAQTTGRVKFALDTSSSTSHTQQCLDLPKLPTPTPASKLPGATFTTPGSLFS